MNQRIWIIRGLPGSGKSTFANAIALSNEVVVEADQFHMIDGQYVYRPELAGRAHEWCQAQVAYWLNQGKTVFISNTFLTLRTLVPYYEMSQEFNVLFEIKTLTQNYGTIHDVPEDTLIAMKERFEDITLESFMEYYNKFHNIFDDFTKEK